MTIFLSVVLFSIPAVAKTAHSFPLDEPIQNLTVESGNELIAVCKKLDIPGGMFLLSVNDVGTHASKLHYKKTSARKLLDVITKQHPNYSWSFEEGVLILAPHEAPELEIFIDHFSAEAAPLNRAVETLALKARMQPAVTDVGSLRSSRRKVTLTLNGVKLRDALNAVVKKDGRAVWVISRDRDNRYISDVEYW